MSEINYISTEENVVYPDNTKTTVDHVGYVPTKTATDISRIPTEQKTVQRLKGFSEIFDILDNSSAEVVTVSRMSWPRSMYIQMQVPDDDSKMDCPYLYISTVDGKFVPWIPTYEDLFARDWVVV